MNQCQRIVCEQHTEKGTIHEKSIQVYSIHLDSRFLRVATREAAIVSFLVAILIYRDQQPVTIGAVQECPYLLVKIGAPGPEFN